MNVSALAWIGAAMLALLPGLPVAAPLPRVTWRGTIQLSDSSTGSFVAHARLFSFPSDYSAPEYHGQYRCHGPGCPFRSGRIVLQPIGIGVDIIRSLTFHRPRRQAQCTYYSPLPPADLAIAGPFQCGGHGVDKHGSISLTATRHPRRAP